MAGSRGSVSLSLPLLASAFLCMASFSSRLSPCGAKDTHEKPEGMQVLTAWNPEEEIPCMDLFRHLHSKSHEGTLNCSAWVICPVLGTITVDQGMGFLDL